MTTDNRTNEPTDEQVEAAAQAVREVDARAGLIADVDLPMYRARAALVAAQGAAPQAQVLPETGNELRDEDGDLISSGKHLRILLQGMYVCDTCTNVLGLNVRWDHAVKRDDHAPVLPSSGVDEDKLAELIESIIRENWEMFDDRRHQAQVISRAVIASRAEWLKEQGR